jgi:prolyl-tRNA editing enzyme YbaK/EbsC (Cys-tRNA(Pro) deacylase)
MWPDAVERIAAFIRSSGAEARIEELPAGLDSLPDPALRADSFDCDGRRLVVLAPADRVVDRDKVSSAAGCGRLRTGPSAAFPFQEARVYLDRSLLTQPIVWLEAGSPRHLLGLAPSELVRLTRAQSADLLLAGEVRDRGRG